MRDCHWRHRLQQGLLEDGEAYLDAGEFWVPAVREGGADPQRERQVVG